MPNNIQFLKNAIKASIYFFIPLYIFALVLPVSAQNLGYAKGLKNPIPLGGSIAGQSIFVDNAGNTYVAGTFFRTADFDPGTGRADLTSNVDNLDIFIAKYDALGNYQYAKRIGGLYTDFVLDIAVDASGNVYITGYFSGTADFDPGAGVVALTSAGEDDMFIAKYDASGNYLFAKAIGNSASDNSRGIALDGSGNVYVTGSFSGTVDFDPGAGLATLTSTGAEDIFIAKYSSSGDYIYAKAMEGSEDFGASGNGIAVDNFGNTYITGSFEETVDFDPGAGFANLISAGDVDIFIARYDASGNYVYAKRIGNTGTDNGAHIGIDASGNTFITGFFEETVDFNPGAGTANLISTGFTDIFVAGYDALGNFVYANGLGSTSFDFGSDIAVDAAGNAYITGYFQGTVDFDPGAGTVALTSAGFDDVFVAGYGPSGSYIHAKSVGGIGTDNGNSLAIDGSGNAFVTGLFSFTADFDPGAGTAALTIDENGHNAFVLRLNNTGNYIQAIQLGNYSLNGSSNAGFGIAVDPSGNSYVTGFFSGTVDFDPGVGNADLTSVSSEKIFISKYDVSGNYVYAKAIGGTDNNRGNSIVLDALSNVYITGIFNGTVDFDPGVGDASLTSVAGSSDIFIAKYDASGNYIYAKAIGGAGIDEGYNIAIDLSGNIYITGSFTGTADFDPGASTSNLISAGTYDAFVAKYNTAGNFVYAKRIGGTGRDYGYATAVDGFGNICVTGSFTNIADLIGGAGTITLTSAGAEDIFIAKYDAAGNNMYAKSIGGSNREEGASISSDAVGNIFLAGSFSGIADFDPGVGTVALTSSGNQDIFIARYNASGDIVYAKAIGGTSDELGFSIAADGSGNAYITGTFSDVVDFDPGIAIVPLFSEYQGDIFVAKYDPSGNYIYAKAAGGAIGGGGGNSIAVDGSGNAYITGSFDYTADFDAGGGSSNSIISSINGGDIFIAKYGPSTGLPVDLTNFTAKPINNNKAVQVIWTTASQTNHAYFEVQRSEDGVHFAAVGRRQGCANCTSVQHYDLTDNDPYNGLSYYRLKQVDIDEKFTYSKVVEINTGNTSKLVMNVYPNLTDGAFEVRIKNNQDKRQVVIQLFNASGKLLREQTERLNEGSNTFHYTLSDRASGVYFIRMMDTQDNSVSPVIIIKK